jgi:Domain of unknown function (DUF3576)
MNSVFPVIRFTAIVAATVLSLAACSSSKPSPTAPNEMGQGGPTDTQLGKIGGEDSGVLFGVTKDRDKVGPGGGAAGIGVNAYLWRGALDTLGFMPLNSIDPFGGVIITDWYTPPATSGERFKATAYVLTKELRSDGVKVSIFRQVLQGNQWVDSPVAASTVSEIEDKVLARARRLREQAGGGNG